MPEETPRKDPAADVPQIPLLFLMAHIADEKAKQEQLVPPQSGPAPLPSEVTPPITRDDFRQ